MDITIKSPDALEAIAAELDAAETITTTTEADALRAILTRFGNLAKHGQRIQIARYTACDPGRRIDIDEADYLRIGGKLAKGLMLIDDWAKLDGGNSGRVGGDALAVVDGQFLRLKYDGAWSNWQGAPTWWCAGGSTRHIDHMDGSGEGGYHKFITPEEVLKHHTLAEVLAGLGKAVKESADRLPKRLAKMKERETLAAAAVKALA